MILPFEQTTNCYLEHLELKTISLGFPSYFKPNFLTVKIAKFVRFFWKKSQQKLALIWFFSLQTSLTQFVILCIGLRQPLFAKSTFESTVFQNVSFSMANYQSGFST